MSKGIPIARIAKFIITGVDKNNKRFRKESNSYEYACMINLWNGSVWALLDDGKRRLIKRVTN